MKKIYTIILLAVFGLSFNMNAQITGSYNGSAQVQCTTIFTVDETYDDVLVTIKASSPGYCLEVAEIELLDGTSMPPVEFCNVTATPSGSNYTLTAPSVTFIIPEITIPPIEPYFPSGATLTDVPVTVALTNGLVVGNTLILKITATAKLLGGLVSIPITIDYMGTKVVAPFDGEGTETSPYLIKTHQDLKKLSELMISDNNAYSYKHYKVVNDIDLSTYQSGNGWVPIGVGPDFVFTGQFDGNNKKITGLKITGSVVAYAGLFGYVMNSGIRNIIIENANIEQNWQTVNNYWTHCGGVVGYIIFSSIDNCKVSGKITNTGDYKYAYAGGVAGKIGAQCMITNCSSTATVNGTKFVGGVGGYMEGSNIRNCNTEGAVAGASIDSCAYVGGILGLGYYSTISGCYSKGTVTGSVTGEGASYIGGIAGSIDKNFIISQCYSEADVSNSANLVSIAGGIVGTIVMAGEPCNISDCYATGKISTTSVESTSGAAGIVGFSFGAKITSCYSTSPINSSSGTNYVLAGGIIGFLYKTEITNCAGLNPSITSTGNYQFGRISAIVGAQSTYTNNIGFSDMLNPSGTTIWHYKGLDKIDGADFTAEQIAADGTLGGRFTEGRGGWTIKNGFLPGLFGQVVEIPEFLEPNGIASAELSNQITVWPNPTNGELTIDNGQLTINSVEIYDVLGKKQLSIINCQLSIEKMDVTDLSNGIYFLKISTETGVVTKKIIKN